MTLLRENFPKSLQKEIASNLLESIAQFVATDVEKILSETLTELDNSDIDKNTNLLVK